MQVAESFNGPSRLKSMAVFFHAHKKKPRRLVTCEAGENPKAGAMNLRSDISENIKVVNQL